MKAILIFSSIFYILGLKIGHKIDLFKIHNPVEKISSTTNTVKQATKTVYFNDEVKTKTDADSLKNVREVEKTAREENRL